jgi:hypothetical protein
MSLPLGKANISRQCNISKNGYPARAQPGCIPVCPSFRKWSSLVARIILRDFLVSAADRERQDTEFLIANTRLEFELSAKDSSRLQISNRERIAIFSSVVSCESRSSPISSVFSSNLEPLTSNLQLLTGTPRLEIVTIPILSTISKFSNRDKNAVFASAVAECDFFHRRRPAYQDSTSERVVSSVAIVVDSGSHA